MILHMNITKDRVKGSISMLNGRKRGDLIMFEITKGYGYEKWGGRLEALQLAGPLVEKIQEMYFNGELGVMPKEAK